MYYRSLISICFVLIVNFSFGQKSKLLAGPTIGHVGYDDAKVWIGYQGIGAHQFFLKDTSLNRIFEPDTLYYLSANNQVATTAHFKNLSPDTYYQIIINIQGWGYNFNNFLKTRSLTEETPKDFKIAVGSCNLILQWPFKLWWPGLKIRIHKSIENQKTDFMLWLGDNVYYMGKDYASKENMFNRQMKYRQNHQKLNDLLAAQPNYSIWDDHDFGPNDYGGYFELKDDALEVYSNFWPNPSFGLDTLPGIFFNFTYEDADFFMTGNRYYQTLENIKDREMLGSEQIKWLKNGLLNSTATFKFIAIGSQVFNTANTHESYLRYPEERDDLLNFITENKIEGVVFLTGDRHVGAVHTFERENDYTLFDFTCSPLLSPGGKIVGFWERNNPSRLEGSMITKRNYTIIEFSGEKNNRSLDILYYDKRGKLLRDYNLHENDLK